MIVNRDSNFAILHNEYPKAAWEWEWQYVFPAAGLSVDPRPGVIRRHHVGDEVLQCAMRQAMRGLGSATGSPLDAVAAS